MRLLQRIVLLLFVVALILTLLATAIGDSSGPSELKVQIKYHIPSSGDRDMKWHQYARQRKPYHGVAATNRPDLLKPGSSWNVPGFGTFTVTDKAPKGTMTLEVYVDKKHVEFLESKYNMRQWKVQRVN